MQQQLEGGLILRSLSEGVPSDHANIATFYSETFGDAGNDDTIALGEWTRTLISGRHPTTTHEDVWVVVDPAKDEQIVSAVLLIPQIWHYGGIPVGVGRVELVATHKEYRRRGLVRAQMEAAHQRSAQLGHLMQSITGISHYYRRFGYAMAVELGARASLPLFSIQPLPDDQTPKYTLRLATVYDAEQLAAWDSDHAGKGGLTYPRSADVWRFELTGRHDDEVYKLYTHLIERAETGESVGYIVLRASKEEKFFPVMSYVVGDQASYLETFDDVMRGAKTFAEEFYRDMPKFMPDMILFDTGIHEAVDQIIQGTSGGRVLPDTYAWYIRVADIPAFIQQIAPVLEARLRGSGANAYTGSLKIAFGDLTGVEMTFERGKIVDVVSRLFDLYEGDVRFPYHSFLNILFGHRTQEELYHIFPESHANAKARVLLKALFPKQRAWLFALG